MRPWPSVKHWATPKSRHSAGRNLWPSDTERQHVNSTLHSVYRKIIKTIIPTLTAPSLSVSVYLVLSHYVRLIPAVFPSCFHSLVSPLCILARCFPLPVVMSYPLCAVCFLLAPVFVFSSALSFLVSLISSFWSPEFLLSSRLSCFLSCILFCFYILPATAQPWHLLYNFCEQLILLKNIMEITQFFSAETYCKAGPLLCRSLIDVVSF